MEKGAPVAELRILFRVPVSKVFEAFVEPDITTKFWFTQSDGRLEPGKHVNWRWEKRDLTVPVHVLEVEPDKRILMEWGKGDDRSTVEWTFTAQSDDSTSVNILNSNFKGSLEEIVAKAIDSQGGFSKMLGDAKAFLESDGNVSPIAENDPEEV